MSLITYYFNAHSTAWNTNPNNMDDGNTATYASTRPDGSITQREIANTCVGTNLGQITKVEIRAHAYCGSSYGVDILLQPVFGGGEGTYAYIGDLSGSWSSYRDITSDSNAPSPWTWADIQNLECNVKVSGAPKSSASCSRVDIRVTYDAYIDIGLRIKAGSGIKIIACQTLDSHKLRIRKGGTTYGVVLGTPGDPGDSGLRIYDGSAVKAIMEID